MKFESKYGIGEICIYNDDAYRRHRKMEDLLVKIVAVNFEMDGSVCYTIEHSAHLKGIQRITLCEGMLTGDPDFDQETGAYLPESTQ